MSIEKLIEKADKQMDYSAYKKAQKLYEQALDMMLEPQIEHPLYFEVQAAIGDVLISQGKNREAQKLIERLLKQEEAQGKAYLHLRLGQLLFESNKMAEAEAELKIALEMGGEELFEGEYEEYYLCAKGELEE